METTQTGLTPADVEKLFAPFAPEELDVKRQALNRAKDSAMLVLYVSHTSVYRRIESVDPNWIHQVGAPAWQGEQCFVPSTLTIKGITRSNFGEGSDPKGATSDSIKRAGMLFGIGRYLSETGRVWIAYNEKTDKYKTYSIEQWIEAAKDHGLPCPPGFEKYKNPAPVGAQKAAAASGKPVDIVEAEIVQLEALKVPRDHVFAFLNKNRPVNDAAAAKLLHDTRLNTRANDLRKKMADAFLAQKAA